jgi:hypothetical protein
MHDPSVQEVGNTSTNFLGVYTDINLNWRSHTNHSIKKSMQNKSHCENPHCRSSRGLLHRIRLSNILYFYIMRTILNVFCMGVKLGVSH